jgi:hypothetical protein
MAMFTRKGGTEATESNESKETGGGANNQEQKRRMKKKMKRRSAIAIIRAQSTEHMEGEDKEQRAEHPWSMRTSAVTGWGHST